MTTEKTIELTDEQCDEFRRYNGTFNDMVRVIFNAGRAQQQAVQEPVSMPIILSKGPYKKHYPQCANCSVAYLKSMKDDCGWACDGVTLYSEIKAAAPQPAQLDQDAEIAALKAELADYKQGKAEGYALAAKQAGEIAALRKDKERLDWLDQNIFTRENLDFRGSLDKTMNMWVMFAPKGHQGSARNILDAAITQVVQPTKEAL
ncbi:MAG: hypothetical protein HQ445_09030 [Polaromonas sp.]|nr:hypothetical protein [Polaromonas sp.]